MPSFATSRTPRVPADRPTAPLDLGPLQPLLDDPAVSEIMVNGPRQVFAERNGRKERSIVEFADESEVQALAERLFAALGKRLDAAAPFADVCMADGTRVNAIVPPLSRFGTTLTLRKFSAAVRTLDDLIARGTLNRNAADFLIACIRGKVNILFSGGTGVGKTTLLQMLSGFFADNERVITIEDAAELKLAQENVVSLETRSSTADGVGQVSLRDLIRNALRMAPDRLIVGEVRGAEAIDMIQAMATGHAGTLGVIHGSSPRDVITRLETMIMMAGLNLPLADVRKHIAATVQIVVHLERLANGVRQVSAITELRGLEGDEILYNDLFIVAAGDDGGPDGLQPVIHEYPKFFQRLKQLGLLRAEVFHKPSPMTAQDAGP